MASPARGTIGAKIYRRKGEELWTSTSPVPTSTRRSAYLEAEGFDPRLRVGGEEVLLAADLASAGWGLAYVVDLTVHHHPSTERDVRARRRTGLRNALWFAWLRRPILIATRRTLRVLPWVTPTPG